MNRKNIRAVADLIEAGAEHFTMEYCSECIIGQSRHVAGVRSSACWNSKDMMTFFGLPWTQEGDGVRCAIYLAQGRKTLRLEDITRAHAVAFLRLLAAMRKTPTALQVESLWAEVTSEG